MTTDSTSRTHDGDDIDDAAAALGLEQLRRAQRQALDAVVAGGDVLAVMPTGSGKSAIYQIAAAVLGRPAIVVSPLLALQRDQLDGLATSDLPGARSIDGDTGDAERDEILHDLARGGASYLFITPESLTNQLLLDRLADLDIGLLAVDEAHCIVGWGHGHRPAYLLLGEVRERLGHPTCVALTASADPRMRGEISRLLRLEDPLVLVDDLHRPDLFVGLSTAADRRQAEADLLAFVSRTDGKALVYVPTRAKAEELAEELAGQRSTWAFHGGMPQARRDEVLRAFRDSDDAVVVATTAFGMGIDIADIATIAHLDLPPTLIDYYQEIGRAGRDGRPARTWAFVGARKRSRRDFAGGVRRVDADGCLAVYRAAVAGTVNKRTLASELGLTTGEVTRALVVLEGRGAVTTTPRLRVTGPAPGVDELAAACVEYEEFDRSQRQAVARYRTATTCRWQQILAALGQASESCGTDCDSCADRGGAESRRASTVESVQVVHDTFGPGVVAAVDDGIATIVFDRAGPKTLDWELCLSEGLLVVDDG